MQKSSARNNRNSSKAHKKKQGKSYREEGEDVTYSSLLIDGLSTTNKLEELI
jgi:hypothetical protein